VSQIYHVFITIAAMIGSVWTPGGTPIWKGRGCSSYLLWVLKSSFGPPHRFWYLLARLLSDKRSTVGALMVPFRVGSQKKYGGPYSEKLWPRSWKCFFTIRTDPKPVNNLFIFFQALKLLVTVTVVRDRKIWTALRNNQIVGFVTVPLGKKIKCVM